MICTSIASMNFQEVKDLLAVCEMVELRIDSLDFSDSQLEELIRGSKASIVSTCRPGNKRTEAERVLLLCKTVEWGASWVDIEIECPSESKQAVRLAAHQIAELIISYHDYLRTPVRIELESIVQQCFDEGADVAKVACTVNSHKDAARILGLYSHFTGIVALGMGDLGKVTRISAPLLGAPFTFAAPDDGQKTAPGQLTTTELRELYAILEKAK
jgi:3-dehydroquinate dehydratase type I